MSIDKKYTFNPRTLMYEVKKRSRMSRVFGPLLLLSVSLVMSVVYFWIYTSVLGLELPKTALLKKKNAEWCSKVEVLNRQLDSYEEDLSSLQMRDDGIYRSIFGMNEIPSEVRNAGFGGVNRYAHYDDIDPDGLLKSTAIKLDVLTKKTYVQSRSFDEVAMLSKRAGDMAKCIPAIPPVNPDPAKYRLSSGFGSDKRPYSPSYGSGFCNEAGQSGIFDRRRSGGEREVRILRLWKPGGHRSWIRIQDKICPPEGSRSSGRNEDKEGRVHRSERQLGKIFRSASPL